VVIAGGAEQPRNLPIPGRGWMGSTTRWNFYRSRTGAWPETWVCRTCGRPATVVIIGGGDTGLRLRRHVEPAWRDIHYGRSSFCEARRSADQPVLALLAACALRTSSSHEEGVTRDWAIGSKSSSARNGKVKAAQGRAACSGSTARCRKCRHRVHHARDLVLLAMGFVSPVQSLLEEFGIEKDARGNARPPPTGPRLLRHLGGKRCSRPATARRGQSLVVWAIREGRQCARAVDEFLMGSS
jgi:glutamate synthase (NADPH/NADH) small chain